MLASLALILSVLALWISALPAWMSGGCSLLLILLGARAMHRAGWRLAASRIRCLECTDGRWRLELESGASLSIFPCSSSLLLPWLIIFRARVDAPGEFCNLLLAKDAFAPESWRRLQLNLRQTLS